MEFWEGNSLRKCPVALWQPGAEKLASQHFGKLQKVGKFHLWIVRGWRGVRNGFVTVDAQGTMSRCFGILCYNNSGIGSQISFQLGKVTLQNKYLVVMGDKNTVRSIKKKCGRNHPSDRLCSFPSLTPPGTLITFTQHISLQPPQAFISPSWQTCFSDSWLQEKTSMAVLRFITIPEVLHYYTFIKKLQEAYWLFSLQTWVPKVTLTLRAISSLDYHVTPLKTVIE